MVLIRYQSTHLYYVHAIVFALFSDIEEVYIYIYLLVNTSTGSHKACIESYISKYIYIYKHVDESLTQRSVPPLILFVITFNRLLYSIKVRYHHSTESIPGRKNR